MNAVYDILRMVVGAALAPFASAPPWVGLVVFSAVSGVLAAIAFRYTSNQSALKRISQDTRAALLTLRLFNDDMLVTFKAQGSLLKAAGLRLFHSLMPMVVLLIPFVLLLGQLAMYYEFAPFKPGPVRDPALAPRVEMEIAPAAWDSLRDITLTTPEGVAIDGRLREPPRVIKKAPDEQGVTSNGMITWRLRAEKDLGPRPVPLVWQVDGRTIEKQLVVDAQQRGMNFVSPKRCGGSWTSLADSLLYPGEPVFDASSPVRSIAINYPSRSDPWLGVPVWLWIFLGVSIAAALAMKPVLGVQF